MSKLTEKQKKALINGLWSGKWNDRNLPDFVMRMNAEELTNGIKHAFGGASINVFSNHTSEALTKNVYYFAANKTACEIKELNKLMLDKKGNLVDKTTFTARASSLSDRYNIDYLQTEYDTAISKATAARDWDKIQATKKDFPFLRYVATLDKNTRPKHRKLHGITRMVDDPFWDRYYPPNGWRCRCRVQKKRTGKKTDLRKVQPPEPDKDFDFNTGKKKKIFGPKHPYNSGTQGTIKQTAATLAEKEFNKAKQKAVRWEKCDNKFDANKQLGQLSNVKSATIDEKCALKNVNRAGKKFHELSTSGIIRGQKPITIEFKHLPPSNTTGGSFEMSTHITTYFEFRKAKMMISTNWDNQISKVMKQNRKTLENTRTRLLYQLDEIKKDIKHAKEKFARVGGRENREYLEYLEERKANIERMLNGEYSREAIEKRLKEANAQIQGETLESTVVHEFGHYLHVDLKSNYFAYPKSVRDHLYSIQQKYDFYAKEPGRIFDPNPLLKSDMFDSNRVKYAHTVSGYANANTKEYFAESWTKYMKGEKLQDKELSKLFDLLTKTETP
ncbi:MAG: minor capsid protein [Bacteroidales bacterium]|nr:minor capsid protein [Bacteroidales bacterium]